MSTVLWPVAPFSSRFPANIEPYPGRRSGLLRRRRKCRESAADARTINRPKSPTYSVFRSRHDDGYVVSRV